MAESTVFTWLCERLDAESDLTLIEARGTVRLCLKSAGLVPADLTPDQAAAIATQLLPQELKARGVPDSDAFCERLAGQARLLTDERSAPAPDEVFGSLVRAR